MERRKFLSTTALGCAILPSGAVARSGSNSGREPALLTVTGAITRSNRGPLDPVLDQMMHKQGIKFDKAYAFGFSALTAMPAASIKPTLEYDARPHTLIGPLLADVVMAAGAPKTDAVKLLLRAVDGYAVVAPIKDVRKYRFIVATHLDSRAMPLGGLGPLWAIYDADRFPDIAAKPLAQRFALCPWALYHIEVLAA